MDVSFVVKFRAVAPDPIKVGDKIRVSGEATVHSIEADLVDITALGSDIEYSLGEVEIGLHSNRFEVETA